MRYDMKKIMKRAWAIKKEDNRYVFSECLKMAWEEIKAVVTNTVATIKDWFENKLASEMNLGSMYSMDLFCKIKESEKAVYCMLYTGYDYRGFARRKCSWIPKSVIENIEALKSYDYEEAVKRFDVKYSI